ncbi:MAG TPA: recombinase family protein [Longimicrobium sp.]|jgi:hypothetical protein|nr:recombinase family protein [Longimicrobium sp.]
MDNAPTPAACYARSCATDPDTIAEQIRLCRACAEANGFAIADEHVFVDSGYSGADFDRPGWQRLQEAALGEAPPFQALIVTEPSRITRGPDPGMFDWARIQFGNAGVTIRVANAPAPNARIDLDLEAWLLAVGEACGCDAMRSARLAVGRAKARADRIHRGLYPTAAPFGFQRVPEDPSPAGLQAAIKSGDWRLEADPATMPVVQFIFDRYEEGSTLAGIGARLTQDSAPTPAGHAWTSRSVRRILSNPLYAGRVTWAKPYHPDELSVIEGWLPDPPIQPARFDALQARLQAKLQAGTRNRVAL